MYQPAPGTFARASDRVRTCPPPGFRLWRAIAASVVFTVIAGGAAAWAYWTNCGNCSPPITCAKRCAHIDRAIEQMRQEQRAKLPDRIEQQ